MLGPLAAVNGLVTHGDNVRVQVVEPDASYWWLTVEAGEARIGTGVLSDPDLWLRASTQSLVSSWLQPSAIDNDVPDVSADGSAWAPMFPFGVCAQPATAKEIPSASLTVQHVNHRSPIGVVRYHDRFVDGRLVARMLGVAHHPDVIVENSFERMVASLQPGAVLLEAIAGARVYGRDPSIMMIAAALYESDELRLHLCPPSAHGLALSALASNTQSSAWQQATNVRGSSHG